LNPAKNLRKSRITAQNYRKYRISLKKTDFLIRTSRSAKAIPQYRTFYRFFPQYRMGKLLIPHIARNSKPAITAIYLSFSRNPALKNLQYRKPQCPPQVVVVKMTKLLRNGDDCTLTSK